MTEDSRGPDPWSGRWIVSACLVGFTCRYDGRCLPCPRVEARLRGQAWVPVCPERLGGLPVPRPGCDLSGGDGRAVWAGSARLVGEDGVDRTEAFRRGALRSLAAAAGARRAILKARSPSCGLHGVHVDGALVPGMGVFTALLARAGVALMTDEDLSGPAGLRR